MLTIDPHPLLDLRGFITRFPKPLVELPSPPALVEQLSPQASAPLSANDDVRQHVRNLLRHGGFKPTGRSKPASEYLVKAAAEGTLRSINLAVDACNAVSLHSGLPISVIDLDLAQAPFRVGIAPAGTSYVFNPSGQTMDIGGLVCLFDAQGPCANAVKDSQRTKTHDGTQRTLTILWGTTHLPNRAQEAMTWYHALLKQHAAAELETFTAKA